MVRLASINAHIKARGGKEQLVRSNEPWGKNYFYFIHCGPNDLPSESIPICRLNQIPLDEWIHIWEQVRAKYQ